MPKRKEDATAAACDYTFHMILKYQAMIDASIEAGMYDERGPDGYRMPKRISPKDMSEEDLAVYEAAKNECLVEIARMEIARRQSIRA